MSSLIVVPVCDRQEMLFLCLEHIAKAELPPQSTVIIALENRLHASTPAEIRDICDCFPELPNPWIRRCPPHSYAGMSYNLMTALELAYQIAPDYVFLVEDDILVAQDFFRWSLAVHEAGEYLCSFSRREHHRQLPWPETPEGYCTAASTYTSTGVCFPFRSLKSIIDHCTHDYFSNMRAYCQRVFPESPLNSRYWEHDALIYNVMTGLHALAAFPTIDRCFHVGWYGCNRGGKEHPQGTLEEKVNQVRAVMFDRKRLAELSSVDDCYPMALTAKPWEKLVRVGHLD